MLHSLTNLVVVALALINSISGGIFASSAQVRPDSSIQAVFSITGTISTNGGGLLLQGVTVTVDPGGVTALTGPDGVYTISGLAVPGDYVATPSLAGYTFSPSSITYTNVSTDQTSQDYSATAITYTISGNAGVSGVTLTYTDGSLKTATSGAGGSYSFAVSYNFSGTVTPSKAGFTFTPPSITYSNVLADTPSQNYAITAVTYTISGTAGVGFAILNYVDGSSKTATALADGSYSFTVSYNWSGTVTPSLTGYTFSPTFRTYTNVSTDQTSQDYSATAITYTISGNAGVSGVTLTYTDGSLKTATSGAGGSYSFTVSYNFSGTVTPSKAGFTFTPPSITYSNVLADTPSQNYAITAVTYTISGTAGVGFAILNYVDGSSKTATALADGSYSFTVSYNWSGTVTPSLTGYTFSPTFRTYTNVLADVPAQNYTTTAVTYTISGNAGVSGVTLTYTDVTLKTATSGAGGSYSFTVSNNWSGTVTPSKAGFTFTPPSITYTNVLADTPSQNYAITAVTYTISGNAGVGLATLSYTDGIPKTTTALADGSYSFTVSYNWSGTVTPSMAGYTFSPTSIPYTNVLSNKTLQNYTATPVTFTISGNAGIGLVTLNYTDGLPKTATAAANGSYSFTVSYNWSGTVTPSLQSYTFAPPSRTYTNVLANIPNQDYVATLLTYTISGTVMDNGSALAGVAIIDGIGDTVLTQANGSYLFTGLPAGNYTITPSRADTIFIPVSKSVILGPNASGVDFTVQHFIYYLPDVMNTPPDPTIYDDFAGADRGWQPVITAGGTADISNGYYRLYHSLAQQFMAALAPLSASQIPAAGYVVQVVATLTQGSDSRIGIVFDWKDISASSKTFQMLVIQPGTQNYWVYKWDGAYHVVTSGHSSAINSSLGSTNQILLYRRAGTVQFFINNTDVSGLVTDAKTINGVVGLQLSVYSSKPGEGHFDNFRISKLP